jgi:NADPH:quinone reductase-like Zn-dependent oxidoreductase
MRAVAVRDWGDRSRLELIEHDVPPVAPDGVLVRVKAAGVNPVDTKVRGGYMAQALPFHFPVILGWDVAGVVEEVGAAVTWFKPGDRVYGYVRRHHLEYGTYAEFTTAPEGFFAHMPAELSFEEAAALPTPALTAHQSLEALGLRGGETLFVGGGAGGVGHVTIQLAVARGARVVATASRRNHDFLRELGAEPLDYES